MDSEATTESLRQDLDDEIEKFRYDKRRIRSLKTERNRLAPISTLPGELLSTIFLKYVRVVHPGGPSRVDQWSPLITTICSHWRDVALAYPDLWTHLHLRSCSWTEVMLARSKNARLVAVCPPPAKVTTSLNLCEKHLDRVRVLHIGLSSVNTLSWWGRPLISIESLQISGDHLYGRESGESRRFMIDRPFTRCPIHLRRLRMLNCFIPWTSVLFTSSITELETSYPDCSQAGFSFAEFLEAMERMPDLESLTLRELPGLPPPAPSQCVRQVSLVNLRFLTITYYFLQYRILFSHIQAPRSTQFTLNCSFARPSPEALDQMSDALQQLTTHSFPNPNYISKLDFSNSFGGLTLKILASLFNCTVVFSRWPMIRHSESARQIFDLMDLSLLQTIKFDINVHADVWTRTFSHLPYLREICSTETGCSPIPVLADALAKADAKSNSFFPSLVTLTLGHIDSSCVEGVMDFFCQRHENGCPIEVLRLMKGNIESFSLSEMEKWVGSIEVHDRMSDLWFE